ncbi:MAG: TonB-dependent receptor plug domain-containing protein [Candidatus Cloacimonetes bacterium]|nr:TonB-dependent receptor plug domain-containing protein [Candidatus Cloacimonadota bacterium]
MKQVILLTLLVLILSVDAVMLKVTDEEHNPLKSVIILNHNKAFYTDKDGKAEVGVVMDSLKFIRPGYLQKTVSDNEIMKDVILIKKAYQLPGVRVVSPQEDISFKFGDSEKIVINNDDKVYDNSADIFKSRTDIKVGNANMTGEKQSVSLLGHSSRHTAIIVDGVVMNPAGSEFDISTIPVDLIESIEIVKNNASAGSGALAGAINIKTNRVKAESRFSLWSKVEIGSFGYNKEILGTDSRLKKINLQLLLSRLTTDNDYAYKTRAYSNQPSETVKRQNNAKEIYDLNLKAELPYKSLLTTYALMYEEFEKQMPGSTNYEMHYDKALQTGHILRHNLNLTYADYLDFSAFHHISFSDYDNSNSTTQASILKTHNTNETTKSGSFLAWQFKKQQWMVNARTEYGLDTYSSEDFITTANSVDNKESSYFAGSFALKVTPKVGSLLWENDGSVRYDNYKLFGDYTSFRIYSGLLYEGLLNYKVGMSVGTGFTVPSMESLYWKGLPSAIGNEELDAETSKGWQILSEIEYPDHFKVKYTYNRNSIDDMIYWLRSSLSGGVWKPDNVGKAQLTNHEVGMEIYPVKNLAVKSNCTFTEALDKTETFINKHLVYIPEYQLATIIEYNIFKCLFTIDWNYTGRQWTTRDNLIKPLEAYGLLNVGVNRRFKSKRMEHQVSVQVNNVLSEQYEVIAYIPQPGINWTLAYKIKIDI